MVVLHGWGSSAQLMRPVAAALEDRWRVYTVDLPGHGQAPVPDQAMDVADHAHAVHDLIRERAPGGATIVGHSNGGRIALWMASDPDLQGAVRRLVLIGPSGVRRRRSIGYWLRRGTATLLKAPFSMLPQRARAFGLDWLRHSLAWRLLGSSDYRRVEGVMREVFIRSVNTYLEDRLASVRVPVLVFRGTRDDAVTRRQVQTLVSGLPDAGLVELEGAGHYAYLDAPDVFAAGTRRFLEGDAA